jgi:methylglutaconyl-CoA hydratase
MIENGSVETSIHNGIGTVSFFHPQSNSLPGILLHQLADAITDAGINPDCKVIILKSEGEKTFCAGASFDELIAIDTFEKGKEFFSGFALVINAMRNAPKFVIARVQGKAVGGGVGLACAADYALAHSSASVKLSELAIGIGPFVVGPAVERKIGVGAFTDLAINATGWKDSIWAKEKGMYAETFSSIEELDKGINNLAKKLSESNPEAMKLLKKAFWKDADNWDSLLFERAEMSGKLILSDFSKNAINKFKASVQR